MNACAGPGERRGAILELRFRSRQTPMTCISRWNGDWKAMAKKYSCSWLKREKKHLDGRRIDREESVTKELADVARSASKHQQNLKICREGVNAVISGPDRRRTLRVSFLGNSCPGQFPRNWTQLCASVSSEWRKRTINDVYQRAAVWENTRPAPGGLSPTELSHLSLRQVHDET